MAIDSMTQNRWMRSLTALGAVVVMAGGALVAQTPPARPATAAAAKAAAVSTGLRRLTEQQYRNAVADIFGEDVQVAGRMDPIARLPHELQIAGVSRIGVSLAGTEEFDRMALTVAGQVVDEKHRDALVACKPRDAKVPDDECAAKFFLRTGRLVFRRPLGLKDVQMQVAAAAAATRITKDFYQGLQLSLASMLASPKFLFDIDMLEADPSRPGQRRLDAYSKATRLSLFLWNTTPDEGLLAAAARGELHTRLGLARQVDRMLTSPRLETGVRAFFSDMLEFERMADLAKDPVIFPQFAREVKADMPEQTLRTLVDLLVKRNGDYRDVFTTREIFMTRPLGVVYGVPVEPSTGWVKHTFPQDSPRAGLLTHMSFLAAHSHDGRSSPTLRGKALRELILCQAIPDPPANVNFALLNDTKNERLRTVRDRLTVHRNSQACAGCHKIMDPIGLSLENFDGVGGYRTQENGVAIDASGDLDGSKFGDPVGLGQTVRNNPAVPACLVKRASEFALRRPLSEGEAVWAKGLTSRFVAAGHRLPSLLRQIATSDEFFRVTSIPSASSKPVTKEVTQ